MFSEEMEIPDDFVGTLNSSKDTYVFMQVVSTGAEPPTLDDVPALPAESRLLEDEEADTSDATETDSETEEKEPISEE